MKTVSLDGKTYVLTMNEDGKTMTEEVKFNNGMFESPECYQWGFSAAPYKAWEENGSIRWESEYTSEKEGKMMFTGTISGNTLSGNELWHKEGQSDENTPLQGMEKQ